MKDFKEYLQNKGCQPTTVTEKLQILKRLQKQQRKLDQFTYRQVLNLVKKLKQSYSIASVNNQIRVLEEYYNYLIETHQRADNPCQTLRIKTPPKKYHSSLLTPDELEDLYYSYPTTSKTKGYKTAIKYRNKIIVGLMVYQGLGTSSLKLLEVEHLDVRLGKIYIPSGTKLNSRTLKLQPCQILLMQEYIQIHHEVIANFLFPIGNKTKFSSITKLINKELKLINYKVQSLHHIRASVIGNWLKQHNLRKVQIMAGHRTILGTEQYQQNDIDNLQNAIEEFFPI